MFSDVPSTITCFLTAAVLLPLAGFLVEVLAGYWQSSRKSKAAAGIAVACIGTGFVLSATSLYLWCQHTGWGAFSEGHHEAGHHAPAHGHDEDNADPHVGETDENHGDGPAVAESTRNVAGNDEAHAGLSHRDAIKGVYYSLGKFGDLDITLEYYIDSLTLVMFTMVTLIATCIHVFAMGYMSDELTDEYVDHHAHTADGHHVHRPGRFYRFFSYMSLFCFSMLGLVISGSIVQVFVFWELVGICSYLLIGFYTERKTANVAANKAFIMNRVGDFGFLIGLMVLWTACGTFSFGGGTNDAGETKPGLFEMVRGEHWKNSHEWGLQIEERESGGDLVVLHTAEGEEERKLPYHLLVIAGLGIFAGCIGKSAQFPLQTWLPDAMEGPTPVSALVHSATMVAAGVYLAGRFYPVFTAEVLLIIAYIGAITLFVAATIAIVATDIKRVLAYSTISQLGYMMLGIGVAGWAAGLFHLITHAFFKSLMFLASGSVIVGCHHEQEMPKMGGLRKKMPITAYTFLVGVIAISGLAIPGVIGLSGFYSKDGIVASAMAFNKLNPTHYWLFLLPLVTAGITAFYMFRLWFYTFAGQPRDQHIYDHCHESPKEMTIPLIILAVFAAGCAWGFHGLGENAPLHQLLAASEPASAMENLPAQGAQGQLNLPGRHGEVHAVHSQAGLLALIAAAVGTGLAWLIYCTPLIDPAEIKKQLPTPHRFLTEKWQFDELYDAMFVRPAHVVASWFAWFDRNVIDGCLHWLSRLMVTFSRWDRWFDEKAVDGLVNVFGNTTYSIGRSFRVVQTGRMRQYVMFIAVGVLVLFALMFAFTPA